MLTEWLKSEGSKITKRTEWQAFLVAVGVLFANHFFDLGIDPDQIKAMFYGGGLYGVGRGIAKMKLPAAVVDQVLPPKEDDKSDDA